MPRLEVDFMFATPCCLNMLPATKVNAAGAGTGWLTGLRLWKPVNVATTGADRFVIENF